MLGGTHQCGDWSTSPSASDRAFITEGSAKMLPMEAGKEAEHLRDWVGLRPSREGGVRLEREVVKGKEGTVMEVSSALLISCMFFFFLFTFKWSKCKVWKSIIFFKIFFSSSRQN